MSAAASSSACASCPRARTPPPRAPLRLDANAWPGSSKAASAPRTPGARPRSGPAAATRPRCLVGARDHRRLPGHGHRAAPNSAPGLVEEALVGERLGLVVGLDHVADDVARALLSGATLGVAFRAPRPTPLVLGVDGRGCSARHLARRSPSSSKIGGAGSRSRTPYRRPVRCARRSSRRVPESAVAARLQRSPRTLAPLRSTRRRAPADGARPRTSGSSFPRASRGRLPAVERVELRQAALERSTASWSAPRATTACPASSSSRLRQAIPWRSLHGAPVGVLGALVARSASRTSPSKPSTLDVGGSVAPPRRPRRASRRPHGRHVRGFLSACSPTSAE